MKSNELDTLLEQWGASERKRADLSSLEMNALAARVHQKVQAALAADAPSIKQSARFWQTLIPHVRLVPRLSFALSATLILTATLIAAATPSDRTLYDAKVALEKTRASIVKDPSHRASLELELLENGVNELRVLPIQEHNTVTLENILAQVSEHAGNVTRNLEKIEESGFTSESAMKIALQISDKTALTQDTLQSLQKDAPLSLQHTLKDAVHKVKKAQLSALRVLVVYSDRNTNEKITANRIVKESLQRELNSTRKTLNQVRAAIVSSETSDMGDDAILASAEQELTKAEHALVEGNFTSALQSLVESKDLIEPGDNNLSDTPQLSALTGNNEAETPSSTDPVIPIPSSTDSVIGDAAASSSAGDQQSVKGVSDEKIPESSGNQKDKLPNVKNNQKEAVSSEKSPDKSDGSQNGENTEYPVGLDL